MTTKRTFSVVLWLTLVSWAKGGTARADSFVPLAQVGGENPVLKIRVLNYSGSTNGGMWVEVNNPSKTEQKFVADGIFFVPAGDPDKAPQRLGAAGPFQEIREGKAAPHTQQVTVSPGETKRLALEVFCSDAHRGSPSSSTQFSVAKERLPKELRQEIRKGNDSILGANGGDVGKSKGAIQSNMWKERDKKWIKLEGERKIEKSSPPPRDLNRTPRIQQQQSEPR